MGHDSFLGTSMVKAIWVPSGDQRTLEADFSRRVIWVVPLQVHVFHKQLRAPGLTLRNIGNAGAVGRPGRTAAPRKEAVAAAIGIHDPKVAHPAVVDLVDPRAGINDLHAIGRDHRTRHRFHVEEMLKGQLVDLLRHALLRRKNEQAEQCKAKKFQFIHCRIGLDLTRLKAIKNTTIPHTIVPHKQYTIKA
jgi:hypothetical protein